MPYTPGSNTANFNSCAGWNGQNGNVTTVGSNGGPSAYGTFDMSGNVSEWNDLAGAAGTSRGLRGGDWFLSAVFLSSSSRGTDGPSFEGSGVGFRLASSSSFVLNPLNLDFVTVGDTNNSTDSSGYGAVNYVYQIAKYQVTNCEYAAFLNAVASTDSHGLYNTNMGSDPRGGITRSGTSGSFSYTVKTNMENKPVVYVSWFDAARYCNWLHNGKGGGSTETGAYTLNGATTGNAVAKNADASYSIPTENEWYKAAYYKGGGTNAGYWAYATQSDTEPTCVAANSTGDGPVISNYSC